MSNIFKKIFGLSTKLQSMYILLCDKLSFFQRFLCPSPLLAYIDNFNGDITSETILIFAPKDYWVIETQLNVYSEKEALKYAPALFDSNENLHYQVKRNGTNHYTFIAYSPEHLKERINNNPSLSDVEQITFAQWVFSGVSASVKIQENRYLTVVDGIVIEMDGKYLKEATTTDIETILKVPPRQVKSIQLSTLNFDTPAPKTIKTTLFILSLIFANFVMLSYNDFQTISETNSKMETIINSSHLSPISIEREIIIESKRESEKKQLDLRRKCYTLSTLDLPIENVSIVQPSSAQANTEGVVLIPGSKPGDANRLLINGKANSPLRSAKKTGISKLQYDGHSIKVLFDVSDEQHAEETKRILQKKFKKARITMQNHTLEASIK